MEKTMFLPGFDRFSLIVSLPQNNMEVARAAIRGGADLVKVHINASHRASGNHFGTLEEERPFLTALLSESPVPVGLVLGQDPEIIRGDLPELMRMGFQFGSVYLGHAPAAFLLQDKITKMLAVDVNSTPEEVRGLKKLGCEYLEGSIIAPELYHTPLNALDLLRYQNLVEFSGLPVIIPTQKKVRPDEVEAIARCGVASLMIGAVVTGKEAEGIESATAAFKKEIMKLSSRGV